MRTVADTIIEVGNRLNQVWKSGQVIVYVLYVTGWVEQLAIQASLDLQV